MAWLNQLWRSEFPNLGLLVKHLPIDDGGDGNGSKNSSSCCVSLLDPTCPNFDCNQSYQTHALPFYPQNDCIHITSCEGLICLVNQEGKISLCNPTTKQLKFLPRPTMDRFSELSHIIIHSATGFGRDRASNAFKVVRFFDYSYYRGRGYDEHYVEARTVAEVYTLSSGDGNEAGWRNIEYPDTVESCCICDDWSTYIGGTYYWVLRLFEDDGKVEDQLLSFDFATESFSTSSLPVHEDLCEEHFYQLFSRGDDLVVAGYNRPGELGKSGDNLFVFWTLDGDGWKIAHTLVLDPAIVRPIHVQGFAAFFEKKSETGDGLSVVVVHHLLEETYEPLQLKLYDRDEFTKIVSYGKDDDDLLYNAQPMDGNYYIEDDSSDDDDDDN